ncbi:hypothetical protein [Candidatus Skiveiella danica]|uniref:hypothetical protein n=1 Tax=Candidatus Skiveiella danica TaxID=3386177 RepID=UPI0039B97F1C
MEKLVNERLRRIHIVHEWLTEWGGSEDAIRVMLDCYPDARLSATINFLSDATVPFKRAPGTSSDHLSTRMPFVEKGSGTTCHSRRSRWSRWT